MRLVLSTIMLSAYRGYPKRICSHFGRRFVHMYDGVELDFRLWLISFALHLSI